MGKITCTFFAVRGTIKLDTYTLKGVSQMRDTIEYRSSNGVETVYADLYTPEGRPKGIVQIVHGMCEHIGRYQPVME